jgi:hypothetical protein
VSRVKQKSYWGHLASQKYSALLFCVAVLVVASKVITLAAFSNLVMGVVGLYTAFVGGRAWSDGQALKYTGQAADMPAVPQQKPQQKKEDVDAD